MVGKNIKPVSPALSDYILFINIFFVVLILILLLPYTKHLNLITKMNRIILLLVVCLLSCGQHPQVIKTKTSKEKAPPIDNEADDFAERKAALDQLFLLKRDSANFIEQDMGNSLLIGSLFDTSHKDAVLRYQKNDSVAQVYVLRQLAGRWDTIFSARTNTYAGIGIFSDFIEIGDFNGDSIPDLKVIKEHWDMHIGEYADLWLYADNHFTPVPGFDSIISATYDKSTNLIYSYQSTGCADMSMYFGVFKVKGNTVERVKEMICNCCLESNDSCSIEVRGDKPYRVPYKEAYKYVPGFYADAVKEKCAL